MADPRTPGVEPRRRADLLAELLARARLWLPEWSATGRHSDAARALLDVSAGLLSRTAERLDRMADKNRRNLAIWLGLRGAGARGARLPLVLKLGSKVLKPTYAPPAAQLQAEAAGVSLVFETESAVRLVPASVAQVVGVDVAGDHYYLPPPGLSSLDPLSALPALWEVVADAPEGSSTLQLDPPLGLSVGMSLLIAARVFRVLTVKGDIVQLDPPLDVPGGVVAGRDKAQALTHFAPFDELDAGTAGPAAGQPQRVQRDRQLHALYFGHDELLKIESPTTVSVVGGLPMQDHDWQYWGKASSRAEPDWLPLTVALPKGDNPDGRLLLTQATAGSTFEPRVVGSSESRWIRAATRALPAGSQPLVSSAYSLITASAEAGHAELPKMEGFFNTNPLVLSTPFYPLGREPRQFDTFYLGCEEVFSKHGAKAVVDVNLADGAFQFLSSLDVSTPANPIDWRIAGVTKDGRLRLLQLRGQTPSSDPELEFFNDKGTLQLLIGSTAQVVTFSAQERVKPILFTDPRPGFGRTAFGVVVCNDDRNRVWIWSSIDGHWFEREPAPLSAQANPQPEDGITGMAVVNRTLFVCADGSLFARDLTPGAPWRQIDGDLEGIALKTLAAASVVHVSDTDDLLLAVARNQGQETNFLLPLDVQGQEVRLLPPIPSSAGKVSFSEADVPLLAVSAGIPDAKNLAASNAFDFHIVAVEETTDTLERSLRYIHASIDSEDPGKLKLQDAKLAVDASFGELKGMSLDSTLVTPGVTLVLGSTSDSVIGSWRPDVSQQSDQTVQDLVHIDPSEGRLAGNPLLLKNELVIAGFEGSIFLAKLNAPFFAPVETWIERSTLDTLLGLPDSPGITVKSETGTTAATPQQISATLDTSTLDDKLAIFRDGLRTLVPVQPLPETRTGLPIDSAGNPTTYQPLPNPDTANAVNTDPNLSGLVLFKESLPSRVAVIRSTLIEPVTAFEIDPTLIPPPRPGEAILFKPSNEIRSIDTVRTNEEQGEGDSKLVSYTLTVKTPVGKDNRSIVIGETSTEVDGGLITVLRLENAQPYPSVFIEPTKPQLWTFPTGKPEQLEVRPLVQAVVKGANVTAVVTLHRTDAQPPDEPVSGIWSTPPLRRPNQQIEARIEEDFVRGWQWKFKSIDSNPELAWEYSAGRSWQALKDVVDETLAFKRSGTLSFTVPEDMLPADWAGRSNYWLRARLIGGDYGKEEFVVTQEPAPGSLNKSTQTIERRTTGVQPPLILSVGIRHKMETAVPPRSLVAEDAGSFRQLGEANRVDGAVVEAFVPLSTVLARLRPAPVDGGSAPEPGSVEGSRPACSAEGCGCGCAPVSAAEPVAATSGSGAVASPAADSLCLFIGIDGPVVGAPVHLFIAVAQERDLDAAAPLRVEALVEGRFEAVTVEDGTRALGESGLLVLDIGRAPTVTELFGRSLAWLRLSVARTGNWRPSIAGVWLNGVWAQAAQTQTFELLGSARGEPGLVVHLARPPVLRGTLELRVDEPLGEEDIAALRVGDAGAVLTEVDGLPGCWVRWQEVDDPDDEAADARVYAVDDDSGAIRFGDGLHGMIPPIGRNNLVAFRYRRTEPLKRQEDGSPVAAVSVARRQVLGLITPLEGVEAAVAVLDADAGQAPDDAARVLRFAPDLMRHRGRGLTPRDIEALALQAQPALAQARCRLLPDGLRLVLALRGSDPVPPRAVIRAAYDLLREQVSPVLLASGRRFEVVAVRPRALVVTARLALDSLDAAGPVNQALKLRWTALFDAAHGGDDGTGWAIGRSPRPEDLAAQALDLGGLLGLTSLDRLEATPDGRQPWPDAIGPEDLVVLAADGLDLTYAVPALTT